MNFGCVLLTKIDYILVNGLDIFNQNQIIGTYKTKERAIEVLDEIQDLLQNAYVGGSNRVVYQMPKDE